ncbi:MAG: CARDB domain-containing protein [Euryarchaeota archaeon]|nr:CARDB domain-containing protein [Euryarchaeota archaeon]
MKFKTISIILLLFLMAPIYINVAAADSLVVVLPPDGYTYLGESYTIPVTLKNNTGEKIWKCRIEIDTENIPEDKLQYIERIKEKAETIELKDKGEAILELIIRFKNDAPSGEYTIPVLVTGYKTACINEGEYCQPLRPQKGEVTVTLIIGKPMLLMDLDTEFTVESGEELEIPFSIRNVGTATASGVSVNYLIDDELLGKLASPEISKDLNASTVLNETLHLDTAGVEPGEYSLSINITYFDLKNRRKTTEENCTIHIEGKTEEEKYKEKLNEAAAVEADAESLLNNDKFDSALEKYKEAKLLYEELGVSTKVNSINEKINAIDNTIQSIQDSTEEADQEFQDGLQLMNDEAYSAAIEEMKSAKKLYTDLLDLTEKNETYKNTYESKIDDCDENIQHLQEKLSEKEVIVEMPRPKTVFIVAIVLLLSSFVLGIILMRRE